MERNKHNHRKEELRLGEGGDDFTSPLIDVAHKPIVLIGTWLMFGTLTVALMAFVVWGAIAFGREKEEAPLFVYVAAAGLLFLCFVNGLLLFRVTKRFVAFLYWKYILR